MAGFTKNLFSRFSKKAGPKPPNIRFPYIVLALALVRPLGFLSILLSCFVLAGYVLSMESFYRFGFGGSGTHPLTAIMFCLLGISILLVSRKAYHLVIYSAAPVFLLASLRLIELGFGLHLLDVITPFSTQLQSHAMMGNPIVVGVNTVFTCLLFTVGLIFIRLHRPIFVQFFTFLGLGFPILSLTGYAYNVHGFHGAMPPPTVLIAFSTGLAILFATARQGALRAILSPWVTGRFARIFLLLSYLVPISVGYLQKYYVVSGPESALSVFVVLISTFMICMVSASAVFQERVDSKRRLAERHLAFDASHDLLTGLLNRRHFFDNGKLLRERAERNNESLSVIMLDIDHFKRVNDRFGHLTGDAVLQQLAVCITNTARKQDLIARYGGEEFIMLLPETSLDGAMQLGEKLRQTVADQPFPHGEQVTVSIGCSEYVKGDDLQPLIARADEKLYQAKEEGRNRVR